MSKKQICPVCDKPWDYALWTDSKNTICLHDDKVPISPGFDSDSSRHKRYSRRHQILKRHRVGTLPKSYYTPNKKDKPQLRPSKIPKKDGGTGKN